ncbi:hypothetical protein [Leptospira noguchii]|uniref:hypothetical protein n=1 Tax=Leptospira noguchii TaxID=28182 RepID=UPI000AE698E2|nr:hypothetical protein [Leptospira noguchii]UOG54649.1 hypothetical protein MAL09_20640 [Leptospira noguchii]
MFPACNLLTRVKSPVRQAKFLSDFLSPNSRSVYNTFKNFLYELTFNNFIRIFLYNSHLK